MELVLTVIFGFLVLRAIGWYVERRERRWVQKVGE